MRTGALAVGPGVGVEVGVGVRLGAGVVAIARGDVATNRGAGAVDGQDATRTTTTARIAATEANAPNGSFTARSDQAAAGYTVPANETGESVRRLAGPGSRSVTSP